MVAGLHLCFLFQENCLILSPGFHQVMIDQKQNSNQEGQADNHPGSFTDTGRPAKNKNHANAHHDKQDTSQVFAFPGHIQNTENEESKYVVNKKTT